MARITIIGGHGKVALQTAPLLVRAGHQVHAVIRNPAHAADVAQAGATPIVADVEALDSDELAQLVQDHDVVIWSAGAGGGSPERTYAVDRDAAIRTIDAAAAAGVPRFVVVSYYGAGADHGVPQDDPFFPYADAKAAADEHLRASSLAWTIVAPSRLTDDSATGAVETDGPGVTEGEVPRADVAAVLAEVVQRHDLAGTTIEFNRGDVPVGQALDALAAR